MTVTDLFVIEADRRKQQHSGSPGSRPLNIDHELIGVIGENQFAQEADQPLKLRPTKGNGDGGIDFIIPLRYTVDVKCSPKPGHLLADEGKATADIYVLAGYIADERRAVLLGWEWGKKLAQAPVRDFGGGFASHYIARAELRPMHELLSRIMRLV